MRTGELGFGGSLIDFGRFMQFYASASRTDSFGERRLPTIPTLTATLSPPGILEIGPGLLLTPRFGNPLWFVAALVNKLVRWCAWLLSNTLEILRLRLRL